MQIYNSQDNTTLIIVNENYYHYDGLSLAIPSTIMSIHNHLRAWYGAPQVPNLLKREIPRIIYSESPRQQDGWSYAMNARHA